MKNEPVVPFGWCWFESEENKSPYTLITGYTYERFSTMKPDGSAKIDEGSLIPLYTQDQLEEARKLGMQQERAMWNLSASTQEIMDTHPVKELNDGGEPVKNATYWKRQYNLMATQNDNLKSGLYHANEQIKYFESQIEALKKKLNEAIDAEKDRRFE